MSGEVERAVFSIVCIGTAEDPAPGSGAALRATARLREQVPSALRQGRLAADLVAYADGVAVACFHNSSAALGFAGAVVADAAAAGDTGPCKASLHMGAVAVHGLADAEVAQRPAVRAGLQILRLTQPGQVLTSQLFFNIVSQFDHRCRELLAPAGTVLDRNGKPMQLFRLAAQAEGVEERSGRRESRQRDGAFLPEDSAARQSALASAERLLAEEIGPIARIVVQRAAENVPTKVAFCQRVVAAVPDPGKRERLMQQLLAQFGL